jgi:hypothetical protein
MIGWIRDLIFGVRLALAGGRRPVGRLLLTAVSTGLGVAVLLLAAAVPGMWHARDDRSGTITALTTGQPVSWQAPLQVRADALYVAQIGTMYRGLYIDGFYVKSGGAGAPVPPGLDRIPAPGEVYLSPQLQKLLRSQDGELLRPRFPQRVVGTIGHAGLTSPRDYLFYAGTASVRGFDTTASMSAVTGFGSSYPREPLPPVLWLLLVVGVVVLLIPVLTVIATAGRVGGLSRDRRLAALRLVGAGARQTRRIAAGEALAGSLAGVLLGVVLFVAGRAVVPSIEVWDMSFFSEDIRPAWPMAALVLLLGPVLAVQAALFALRGAIIEPLGVVRQATPVRRRLWWRLAMAGLGVALLVAAMTAPGIEQTDMTRLVLATSLVLISIPIVLPWLIERVVDVMPRGSVPYELAIRRLRLDPGAPARLVGGVAVVLAGAITLQTILLAAEHQTGADNAPAAGRPAAMAPSSVVLDGGVLPAVGQTEAALRGIPGVRLIGTVQQVMVRRADNGSVDRVAVADCATIVAVAPGTGCADGDVFRSTFNYGGESDPRPGQVLQLANGDAGRPAQRWRLPKLRELSSGEFNAALVVTPGALRGIQPLIGGMEVHLSVQTRDQVLVERVRNAIGPLGWQASVQLPPGALYEAPQQVTQYRTIRTGLMLGALVALLLAGASMVALALEQIAERRRPMAVLAASGVPRSVLSRSVLWQNTLPMAVAVPIALVTGVGLGQALLQLVSSRARGFDVDWGGVGVLLLASVVLVLLTTVVTLPALRRATRPTELRSE